MKCNVCGNKDSKVIDSRTSDDGTTIRRRRECTACGHRFTTYETLELVSLLVIKNDGTRQPFDELKIKNGIIKSCEKRPVTARTIEEMVLHVKQHCLNSLVSEISSKKIGELVMEELKKVDDVAYVRFASVHRQFKDVNSFIEEIEKFLKNKND